MKKVSIDENVVGGIKKGRITQIVLEEDLDNGETLLLNNSIQVEITAKAIYKKIEDCFKVVPMDLFGISSLEKAKEEYDCYNKIYVYRIKYDNDNIEDILDLDLLDLINQSTLVKNNIGHSSTNVYEVKLKDNRNAILKIQTLSNRNDLHDEYDRIKWLQNKCRVPQIYYYNEKDNTKYLLMEKLPGKPVYKTDVSTFKIGELLKSIHSIDISDCEFKQNSVESLLDKILDNIDIVVNELQEEYPQMSKKEIVEFINNNVPKDEVLIHGDYSLPNILIDDNGEMGVIDLGDVSVSTKYFDFYHLRKSMIRNKKIDQFEELLKGYGIDKLNENYLKWIEIVDKVLF